MLWNKSPKDIIPFVLSMLQCILVIYLACVWQHFPQHTKHAMLCCSCLLATYNIIIITHNFTHNPWFKLPLLNCFCSIVNSLLIGQSVKLYEISHIRNHHKYNNDRKNKDGMTYDRSSTFRYGKHGNHQSVWGYAISGTFISAYELIRNLVLLLLMPLSEASYLKLTSGALSNSSSRRHREKLQIFFDHLSLSIFLFLLSYYASAYLLFCVIPSYLVAYTLVNVQNYYEHYGANPGDRYGDAVSCYHAVYNALTLNDGYHQEHHLSPTTHWSDLPHLRQQRAPELLKNPRIISKWPAICGFLDRKRPLLHQTNLPVE